MERVSIRFGGGMLVVTEGGKPLGVKRATVYLVEGNDCPVALMELEGTSVEVNVAEFELTDGVPVVADPEIIDSARGRK
jgi:hypothetical protein